jgi:hypothetical protein
VCSFDNEEEVQPCASDKTSASRPGGEEGPAKEISETLGETYPRALPLGPLTRW